MVNSISSWMHGFLFPPSTVSCLNNSVVVFCEAWKRFLTKGINSNYRIAFSVSCFSVKVVATDAVFWPLMLIGF